MSIRPARLLAIFASCAVVGLLVAAGTVTAAVSTVSLPAPYTATALDNGALLLSDASPTSSLSGLRLKPREQTALSPVTVVGDDAAVLGITPLAGGRALILASTGEQAGPWLLSAEGMVERIALGDPGSAVRRASYSVVDDVTPMGMAVGRWETSPLDDDAQAGVWMLDASGAELRTRVAPPPFPGFPDEVFEDQVVTKSGRIVALAVRDGSRIVARVLEPGASTWSDETELTPVVDPAGDPLVGVRTRSARGVFADDVLTGGPAGPFTSVGTGLVIEQRNVRGEVLMRRQTTGGTAGWVVRTRRGPGAPAEQRDLNALLGAGPTEIVDATLDDSGDSGAAWLDGARLLASRIVPGEAPQTRPITCGASGGQIALSSGRVAALTSGVGGNDAVAFSSVSGWRSIALPAGGDWTLTQGSTGDLVALRSTPAGTTAVLSTAAGSDGQALPAEGLGCEPAPAGVTLEVTPTAAGDLDVLLRCDRARACTGALVGFVGSLPLAVRGVHAVAGSEVRRVLRLPASVRTRVLRGAARPTVRLYGPWGRVEARGQLNG